MDKVEKAYEAGRRNGNCENHNHPSPETIKMVGDLNTKIEVSCQKMQDIEDKMLEGFKLNSGEHKEMMDYFKEEMEKLIAQKADKWTESAVKYIGVTLITIVIASLSFLLKETLFK